MSSIRLDNNTLNSTTSGFSTNTSLSVTGNISTTGNITTNGSISASNINISTINGLVPLGETVSETVNVPLLSVSNGYKIESNNGNFYKLNYLESLRETNSVFNVALQAPYINDTINRSLIQADGKIIILGNFTSYSGSSINRIARLNTDFTIDTSFNVGAGASSTVFTTAIQSDGKIIIGGSFSSYSGSSINRIARLNTDGTLDTSFNVGTGINNFVNTSAIQSDGKIIIGGDFTSYSGSSINRITRLNTDGTLDTSFNVGAGADSAVRTTAIQSDGKIIIGGFFTSYSGSTINRVGIFNTDGALDTSFNVGTGANSTVLTTAIQSDGKIIIGGNFTSYSGSSINRLARLNTDGTLDTSFNVGTGANSTVLTTAIQSDGKIIIGGGFGSYSGSSINRIVRLNTDGTLDTSFNVGTGANSTVRTSTIQSDGKIIIGGFFTSYSGSSINRLARINTDGTLDTSFNVGAGANSTVFTTAIQSDGKIIIGGDFTSYSGSSINNIARLNTDGTLDTSFNVGTGASSLVQTIAVQSDGKIIIGGLFTSYSGSSINYIARLNTDGTLDTSFNVGTGASSLVQTIAVQSDGKIIIGGLFTSYSGSSINYIARLNTDGTLDTSFNINPNSSVSTLSLLSNDKIFIGGAFTNGFAVLINRIARINTDGTLDTSFNVGTGANSTVLTTAIQSDGKIIIGGNFTSYSGSSINRLARLNTDGALDTSFNVGNGLLATPASIFLQEDGKIIVGGTFTSYSGSTSNGLVRINPNGTKDETFIGSVLGPPENDGNRVKISHIFKTQDKLAIAGTFYNYNKYNVIKLVTTDLNGNLIINKLDTKNLTATSGSTFLNLGSGFNSTVNVSSVQSDGKIIIGGSFGSYSGSSVNRIARLNTDGTRDTSFNVGAGANSTVFTTAIQSDGKIIIGGSFTSYSGSSINRIARLNTDGTLDTSFNVGSGVNDTIRTTTIQPDGKIIIGGDFTSYSGSSINRLVRLNTDGTLDTSFNVGAGASSTVWTTAVQSDGKIIIGGEFTSYSGSSINRIARLNTSGTLDTSFNVGAGASSTILTSTIQSDGKIIIGGAFTSYSGSSVNRVIRLNTDGSLDTTFSVSFDGTDPSFNSNTEVVLVKAKPNGNILVGGRLFIVNREYTGYGFVELDSSGSIASKPGFTTFESTNSSVYVRTLSFLEDGKIFAGGDFNRYLNQPVGYAVVIDDQTRLPYETNSIINFDSTKKYLGEIKALGTTTVTDLIKFDNTFTVITGSLVSQSLNKSGTYTDYTASVSVTSGSLFVDLENIKGYDGINYAIEITEF
jgi:uncharacterized delta-60 repeat protein